MWVFDGNTCLCKTPEEHCAASHLPKETNGKPTPGYCGSRNDAIGGQYRSRRTSLINFQHKHWFDSVITIRLLLHLERIYHDFERKMLGVILDRTPQHENKEVDQVSRTLAD